MLLELLRHQLQGQFGVTQREPPPWQARVSQLREEGAHSRDRAQREQASRVAVVASPHEIRNQGFGERGPAATTDLTHEAPPCIRSCGQKRRGEGGVLAVQDGQATRELTHLCGVVMECGENRLHIPSDSVPEDAHAAG